MRIINHPDEPTESVIDIYEVSDKFSEYSTKLLVDRKNITDDDLVQIRIAIEDGMHIINTLNDMYEQALVRISFLENELTNTEQKLKCN